LRGFQHEGVVDAIREAGGEIFGITSEPQTLASEAALNWELDFELVGDPHHEIADLCRERGWLDLYVNTVIDASGKFSRGHDAMVHPKGYFQPGLLALTRERRILYRWRGVPTRHNNGGATARPAAGHVWAQIEATRSSPVAPDAALDTHPTLDMQGIPWLLFVPLLLANGNFWHPKGLGMRRRGPADTASQAKSAAAKLVGFVAAWIAAFALLPFAWVGAALLAWMAIATPGLIALHKTFQNVVEE